jgi:hypothetical protein
MAKEDHTVATQRSRRHRNEMMQPGRQAAIGVRRSKESEALGASMVTSYRDEREARQ